MNDTRTEYYLDRVLYYSYLVGDADKRRSTVACFYYFPRT